MNYKEFIQKYEELLNSGYCECNELNCLDNNPPKKILNIMKEQQQEIERLNNIIKTKDKGIIAFTEDLCEESAKVEKAIEYIKKHTENIDRGQYYEDYVETYPILQILKGSDKE